MFVVQLTRHRTSGCSANEDFEMFCLELGPINLSIKVKGVFSFHFHLGRPMSLRPLGCYWTASLCSHSRPFVSGDVISFSGCLRIYCYVSFLQSMSDVWAGDKKYLPFPRRFQTIPAAHRDSHSTETGGGGNMAGTSHSALPPIQH